MKPAYPTSIALDDASGVAEAIALLRELARHPHAPGEILRLRLVVGAAEFRILARLVTLGAPARSPDERRILRVQAEGRWFEAVDAARVDCANRPVMRRVLLA